MSSHIQNRAQYEQAFPGVFFLEKDEPEKLQAYLQSHGHLAPEEMVLSTTKAGEGNMNCTIRVQTNRRTFIVKQARPWVEKYPQFPAPTERVLSEIRFFRLVSEAESLAALMPKFLFADEASFLLGMGDLGAGTDFFPVYSGESFTPGEFDQLREFLTTLHLHFRGRQREIALRNRALREFNHGHLFVVPMDPGNGLTLDRITPGLAPLATALQQDATYRRGVEEAGRHYLEDGDTLIHGDFFPGSFLRTSQGLRVIDPEFCCFGQAEVEIGIFLGHLLLARQSRSEILRFLETYRASAPLEWTPVLRLAGVEIMRRIIGVAQLPLGYGLAEKTALLELSRKLVVEPTLELLSS